MPQFPRSQRTVNAQQSPLPFSTGGGYAAPGAALQQLGKQISSFAGKLQAEQEKADEFAFKTGLQRFANEQEQKYTSYRDTIDGDAGNFPTDVLKGFDKDWSKFQDGIPPQLRQKAELYKERFRGDYQRRSYGDQQRIRSRWYVAQGTDLFAKTILPRVTGDIRSVESGLTATENIIGSMSGVPPQVANKLREQAAQQIFKKWLQAAGPDAAPAAREIIERYKATRIGPTPGSARAAQEGERAPQTAPVPAGGMPDYRGQRGPAPIRYNNPSGQYPGPSARKFGAVGTEIIGGGHKIAVFPTAVHGGAAHFDLLSRAYAGKSIAALVRKWGGGNSPTAYANNVSRQLGVSPDTVVTRQMLQDPSFAIPFAKAMARHETGREYPMSDDQWRQAHAMAFGGAAPTPAAQPITTQDHFHRLIIENAEKIERGETLAQRRSEVDARRKERAIHDATTREGYEMLFDKKLTREWVEANKDNLPTGTYVTFMKAVVPQGRTTDPQVFSHLLERADERPKDIMEEAAQAYARGDLNYDSYRVIASKARKALDPNGQSSAPPWVREQRSIIKQQLRPGRGASQAQYEAYGKALEAYDNYVDRQGAEIDRKALREWSSGLVEQTKKGLVSANKTALPMPRFSQVGRTAMTVEEIDATVERTVRAYRAGKLSKDEFIAEAKALKQWRGVLEDQAGTEGKTIAPPQPKAEGAGKFAAPGLGVRSEVKGTSETVPDQVTQEIAPEVFGQIAEVLGIDPEDISTADILERMQQLPPDHPVWTWIPPALTGRQAEGTGLLPFGRYEMPDGSQQVSFGLPQGLLDAWRSVRYGFGYEQDPNAPEGYVSFDAMNKGAFGAAGGAMTGTVGANAMRVAMRGKNAMASRALIANSDGDILGAAQALFRKGVLSDERRSLPLDKQLEIFMFNPANRRYADEAANLLRAYRERNAADTPSSDALPQPALTAQSAPSPRVSSDATYYHGTRSGISDPKQLQPATEFRDAPSAIFVTPDSDYARFHANGMSGSKGNPSVIPMKLDPENFADVSNAGHIRRIAEQYAKDSGMSVDQAAQFVSSRIRNGQLAWTENEIIKAIQKAGFDGVPLSDAFGPSVAIFNSGAIRKTASSDELKRFVSTNAKKQQDQAPEE